MDPMATNPGDRKEKNAQATYRFTVLLGSNAPQAL
jgi:hypothetical protein